MDREKLCDEVLLKYIQCKRKAMSRTASTGQGPVKESHRLSFPVMKISCQA